MKLFRNAYSGLVENIYPWSETSKTSWNNAEGIKAVRKVYRRVYTHCPTKALIYMKYAAFEESIGNISDNEEECGARYILKTLLKRYPNMIGKSPF